MLFAVIDLHGVGGEIECWWELLYGDGGGNDVDDGNDDDVDDVIPHLRSMTVGSDDDYLLISVAGGSGGGGGESRPRRMNDVALTFRVAQAQAQAQAQWSLTSTHPPLTSSSPSTPTPHITMQPHILDTHNISDRPSQNPHVYGILYQYNLDTPEKALRYFESTSFNDPQSQNFYLNLQTSDRDPDIYTFDSYLLDLENTIGYRYIVDEKSSRLPLWIIHKQLKLKPTDSWELVAVYSILNGIVWQAPNIHDLVQSRLVSQKESYNPCDDNES